VTVTVFLTMAPPFILPHLQDYVDRWRYNAKRAPQAQSRLKILEKLWVIVNTTVGVYRMTELW